MTDEKKTSRRNFFRGLISNSKETVLAVADAGMKLKFRRKIIRPPGALSEEQFLLTCTRCDKCVEGCEYNAIHLVDQVHAGVLLKTPFIDPTYEPCRFCVDMPCIESCTDNALIWPPLGNKTVPPIGIAKINLNHCLAKQGQHCDYCYNSCPNGLKAIIKSEDGSPRIDADLCNGCGKCAYICVSQSGPAIEIEPL